MKDSFGRLTLALALAASIPTSAAHTQEVEAQEAEVQEAKQAAPEVPVSDGVWTISSRTLPAPAGASAALRESIAGMPQPDVASYIEQTTFTTTERWKEVVARADSGGAAGTREFADSVSAAVEEGEIGGVTVWKVTPSEVDPEFADRLFVHVHGGAYVFGGGLAAAYEAIVIADRLGMPAVSIDYRMPPDHPFPAAVDDVVAVWRVLLSERPAASMALGGTSTGGGLTLAATLRFRELGLDLPAALWAGTPWADLTDTGDTLSTNEGIDRALVSYRGILEGCANLYAAGHDLKNPLISPVYGDFTDFPPTYLVTGTRDLFLSDVARVHRKMRVAGVVADLNVYEGVSHADYFGLLDAPEGEQVFGELGEFLAKHMD